MRMLADDDDDAARPAGPAEPDAHRNVVTGTPVDNPARKVRAIFHKNRTGLHL